MILDSALAYAAKGKLVVPLHGLKADGLCTCGRTDCSSPAKHPRSANGLKDATTNSAAIVDWWRQWPNSNVGIATGEQSGIVVLDVDGQEGEATLAALVAQHGPLPATPTVTTGRGKHLYVRHPGREVRNQAARLGPGLDLRGDGGYVVAPPSRHVSGAVYSWVVAPGDVPLADLPSWIITELEKATAKNPAPDLRVIEGGASAYGRKALEEEVARVRSAANGTRNDTLNRAAFAVAQLAAGGEVDPGVAESELVAAGVAVGLDEREVRRTVASGFGDGTKQPRSAPPKTTRKSKPTAAGTRAESSDRFFRETGGLIVSNLAGEIQAEGRIRIGHDARLYRYSRGVNRGDGESFARKRVRELLGERAKKNHAEEVVAWLRADFPSIPETPDSSTLNVRNGLLDWKTGELRAHTPDEPSVAQIPVKWDASAECPAIMTFLEEVLHEDAVNFMIEVIGYALLAANPLRKAVLFLGDGGNGKTTLLNLIMSLLGPRNCASVPLQAFGESRFAVAELFGKLANIAGDLDARAIKRTDLFKTATGNDTLMAERKFGQPFSFVPYALPIFSANEAPESSDQTDAWFSRWLVVPFNRQFTETEADPQLLRKLTTSDELSGLLTLAVAGLNAVMARGRFDEPTSVRDAAGKYRTKLDTVRSFIDEHVEFLVDHSVVCSELYRAYSAWCSDSRRIALSVQSFNGHIARNHGGRVEKRRSDGRERWFGIAYRGGRR